MKVLGVVHWTTRDKLNAPIAGVRPLVELQKDEWRPINANEEFPSQGLLFWPNAQFATEGALVIFGTAANPGQKDEYRVVDPKPVYEVLDLRGIGTEADARVALVEGIHTPGPRGTFRVLVWCKPDVLAGPVEVARVASGAVRLNGENLARVPLYACSEAQVRSVFVDNAKRWLRADDSSPIRYVDWDDDAAVLRRALNVAVRVAKQDGNLVGQTKRQIEDAAKALAAQGIGPDAQLDRYRVDRALALLKNTDAVARNASTLVETLREHAAIKSSLDQLSAKVRAEVEQGARADLEQRLASERAALNEATEASVRLKSDLAVTEQELRKAERQLADAQDHVARVSKEVEVAVNARVLTALSRPLDLLAEISVLRPFLSNGASSTTNTPSLSASSKPDWSRMRGENNKDTASLRRVLTTAARIRGVDPSLMIHVHAAVVARLMPIALGPGALAALTAYAHGACGGRVHIIHVSPSAIQPNDLYELPDGGLVAATAAAMDIDGLSLVILEGANRSPLESTVVPLLQLKEVGLSPFSAAGGLRLAASLVAGATTVPVTSQLWSHAAAIYPEPRAPSTQPGAPGDIALTSELLVPGDEPTSAIEALLDTWPECRELRPALCQFGSALARTHDDELRLTSALLHGLILPYVATALTIEEQAEAVARTDDADGAIALALLRLRRRLT